MVFYRLSRKIINHQADIPEDARQVLYYSLAIGHHVGVMDCFSELMAVPAEQYSQCLDRLPIGEARRKLQGALEWGEIEINAGHADDLLPVLNDILPGMDGFESLWIDTFIRCLHEMVSEPALYLMLRMREMRT